MAYDEELADRIRATMAGEDGLDERMMFGGLAFLVHGHMAVAAAGQHGGLMVRVDPEDTPALVDGAAVTRMEMGGRQLNGWLLVTAEGVATDEALADWAARGVAYARTLPPKR